MPKQFEHWVMQPVYPADDDGIQKCEVRFPKYSDMVMTVTYAELAANTRVSVHQIREAIECASARASRRNS